MAKENERLPEPQDYIADRVVDTEVSQAKSNMMDDYEDFEIAVDLIENERTEKDYDWMSNVSLPEYASHFLTQAAIDAATYFQTRDFVEVYHQDETQESRDAAKANKELINRTLNLRHMRHYSKYMRAKLTNNMFKNCVARLYWEQELQEQVIGTRQRLEESTTTDVNGQPLLLDDQMPRKDVIEEEVMGDVPIIDRFNWDVIDPRNVFYDNTYGYSIQDKEWVTIRYESTLSQLLKDEEEFDYINLDVLAQVRPPVSTDAHDETENKDDDWQPAAKNEKFDIYERHGLDWCIVKEADRRGNPIEIDFGYDNDGEILDDAERHELVITVAVSKTRKVLIRHVPQLYRDYNDDPYRPLIRGLNYIHPAKDGGIGDAEYSRELQIFINDTVNMSNDRVKLATLPTLKGNKYALEDNDTVYFAPEHVIELYNTDDLEEFKISSDISGAAQMLGLGRSMLQQVNATFPTTMGDTPEMASTTATAIAGAEQRTNTRTSYRSLTWEYTFLTEMYWMITQMTAQFAHIDTARKLFGNEENLLAFRPDYEYFYKPVTGAIETEYSKSNKIKESTALIGYLANSTNPKAAALVNMLIAEIFETWGKDKEQYGKALLDESQPVTQQGGVGSIADSGAGQVSNQNVVPISPVEEAARGN